jgi:periplasmic divalent cation tolerance protein
MGEPAACLAYVTCASREEALTIARTLVAERLAAAANLLGPATSFFHWQGALREAEEWVVVLKSRSALVEALIERARALHSYACPGILVLPVLDALPAYLDWLAAETMS